MDELERKFPFLTEKFVTSTNTHYLGGYLNDNHIMISRQNDQYVLTLNSIHLIVCIGCVQEIIDAINKLVNKETVQPNIMAILMRRIIYNM